MTGTASAERIRCDHCTGHYVVDAASDGSPRVRCNECGHVREGAVAAAGKWTVIGPDGKTSSFDSWEELTESRRPSAIAPTAKGMEEANKALKDLKPASSQDRKSGSALLDITPAPKLALADMDSAIDLGETPSSRRPRPSLTTTMTAGSGSGSPGGKLEPLLVKSFSQSPQSQSPPSKVEWAPKIDKSVVPPRVDDTMRAELAPAKAVDRPEELSSSSLLEDKDNDEDEEEAPLSLRDVIQDDDELGDNDLEEDEPDPHEKLSLRDLVVVPNTGSHPPPAKAQSQPPPKSATTSQRPPKPPTPSQGPVKAASQAPPPRPKSLSRPDVRAEAPRLSAPPPSIRPDVDTTEEEEKKPATEKTEKKKPVAVAKVAKEEEQPNRTWMWVAVAAVLLVGIFWRLSQNTEAPKPPETPVATIAPPTPVTTPAMTNQPPPATPTASASDTISVDDTPPATTATPTVATPTPVTNTDPTPTPVTTANTKPAPAETKPPVSNSESAGSMSELLDQAGAAKRKGDLATARDLYGKVLAMNPNNVEANGGLGDVAKAQGDLAAAKASYEKAIAASPTYSPALLGLADVEWDSGNQADAKRRYAQIVDRMGDRAPARAKERSQ